jgi:hypothetical protein
MQQEAIEVGKEADIIFIHVAVADYDVISHGSNGQIPH